jgi:hypothetical protein
MASDTSPLLRVPRLPPFSRLLSLLHADSPDPAQLAAQLHAHPLSLSPFRRPTAASAACLARHAFEWAPAPGGSSADKQTIGESSLPLVRLLSQQLALEEPQAYAMLRRAYRDDQLAALGGCGPECTLRVAERYLGERSAALGCVRRLVFLARHGADEAVGRVAAAALAGMLEQA